MVNLSLDTDNKFPFFSFFLQIFSPGPAQSIPRHNRRLTLCPPRPWERGDASSVPATRYFGSNSPQMNVHWSRSQCWCWCCEESHWSRGPCLLRSPDLMDKRRNHSPPLLNFDDKLFPAIFPNGPRSGSWEGRQSPVSRTWSGKSDSTALVLEESLLNDQDVMLTITLANWGILS